DDVRESLAEGGGERRNIEGVVGSAHIGHFSGPDEAVLQPERSSETLELIAVSGRPVADAHKMRISMNACEACRGREQGGVILHRIQARHAADHKSLLGEPPGAALAETGSWIGPHHVRVDAV